MKATKERKKLTVRLDSETHDKLMSIMDGKDISVNQYFIRLILREYDRLARKNKGDD